MLTYISILNRNRKKDFYGASGFRLKYCVNATFIITAIVLVLWSIIDIPRTMDITSSGDFTQALKYKGNEIVRFSEFDPDTWKTVYKKIEYYNDGEGDMITFDVNQDKTLLMPRMVSEMLEADRVTNNDEDTVRELYYSVNLYKARSSKVASEFMKYNMKDELNEFNDKVSIKSIDKYRFDYNGLDYAAYIADGKEANDTTAKRDQLLFLRKGSTYVSVSYYGPIDLKSKVGMFAAKM